MKRIVILGAGFGGLRAALQISKKIKRLGLDKKYEVVLVNRTGHHTYTPLLYEIATTSEETATTAALREVVAYPLEPIAQHYGITFLKREVTALDLIHGEVYFGREKLNLDYLVLALGSETNYFDIPGLKEFSIAIKTFSDAVRIRDTVWNLARSGMKNVSIVIGGGGPTGVELAAELKAWCGQLEAEFKKCNLDVKIVEAASSILPGLGEHIIRVVGTRLKRLGVETITNGSIVRVKKEKVILKDGRELAADVLIWAGGIKASSVLRAPPLKHEVRGRVIVNSRMQCTPETLGLSFRARVYGLGDSIYFYDPKTQKPVPAVARAAILEANVVAWNIIEDIKMGEGMAAEARHQAYTPREYPYVTPVGGKYAIAKIGRFVLVGFLGWVFKGLVEFNYLLSVMPAIHALRIWLKGLRIFIQNDRLG